MDVAFLTIGIVLTEKGKTMREILFRGKDAFIDKWVTGFLVDEKHIGDWVEANPVNPETVGQFTGLKDKNGKKIFEGDIVEISHDAYHGVRGEVFFEKGSFMLKNVSDVLSLYGFLLWCEVIGNIHDNPELL